MKDPGTDGVPDSTPALDKASPDGRLDPALRLYETPLVAAKVTEVMDEPVSTSTIATSVVHTGESTVLKEKMRSANVPLDERSTRTVKLCALDEDGVPDKTPVRLNIKPLGKEPLIILKPV